MTVFESFKMDNVDEFAEWLDKYGAFDHSPWIEWYDREYCSNCKAETIYSDKLDRDLDCSWCELNGKCKFFQDMEDIPDNKQIIKMWLESEYEYGE